MIPAPGRYPLAVASRHPRNETAVDQHDAVIGHAEWRKYPVTCPEICNGLYQSLRFVKERTGCGNVSILVSGSGYVRPVCRTRRRHCRCVHTLLNSRD